MLRVAPSLPRSLAPSLPRSLAPSLLPAGFGNLAAAAGEVASGADWLHVNVMDAHFVPNLTIGSPVVVSLEKHTGELSSMKYAHRIRVYFELVQRVLRAPSWLSPGAGSAKGHSYRLHDHCLCLYRLSRVPFMIRRKRAGSDNIA